MSLLTPSEAHAFQKFLTSLDTTDFSASWNMQLEVSHEHMPPAPGTEALSRATKDLMSLDAEKWRYPVGHQLPPFTRESPAIQPVNRHPQSQSNSLPFLYSTRRERRPESNDGTSAHLQLPSAHLQPSSSRSRTNITPLERTTESSSVSARTRSRTYTFENASSSSSSLSPIDPSSSRSSSTHNTTPTPVSSSKRSPPPDPNVANKRRRQTSIAPQRTAGDMPLGQSNRASTLLSLSQKKANHIQSEQKRRANIRKGYEALCDTVPPLREAMLAEAMEEEEGKKGGRRRCRGKAGNEDGEKTDGRAGPKSEHVVLSKSQCPERILLSSLILHYSHRLHH